MLAFNGDEAVSRPYCFTLEWVSEHPALDFDTLMHQNAFLAFDEHLNGIHGQIHSVKRHSPGARLTRYDLTLVPSLAYLEHRTNHRIFQNLSVQQIIEQLLNEHGILSDAYTFAAFSPSPPREYCVQYGESDLYFIQRLCCEEGFHYYFKHSPDGHLLVFGDKQQAFTPLVERSEVITRQGRSMKRWLVACAGIVGIGAAAYGYFKEPNTFTFTVDMPLGFKYSAAVYYVPAPGETCTVATKDNLAPTFNYRGWKSYESNAVIESRRTRKGCPLVVYNIKLEIYAVYGNTWRDFGSTTAQVVIKEGLDEIEIEKFDKAGVNTFFGEYWRSLCRAVF